MRVEIKSFWPAIAAFVAATILFCMPGNEFPKSNWLSKVYMDKWVHVGLFTGLVALWCLPFISRIRERTRLLKLFKAIVLAFVGYGILIEFIQGSFVPHRSFSVDDMIADAVGCGFGYFFARKAIPDEKI